MYTCYKVMPDFLGDSDTYIVYLSETEGPHHSFRNKFRIYSILIGLKCTSRVV